MDNVNYVKDLFESILDYTKIVLILFLIKDDKDLLDEVGFSENDINRLSLEFKTILMEQFEEHLDYIKNEKESIFEKFLNKQMKDFTHKRLLLLSLKDQDIL